MLRPANLWSPNCLLLSSSLLSSACATGGEVDDGGFGTFTTVAAEDDDETGDGDGDPGDGDPGDGDPGDGDPGDGDPGDGDPGDGDPGDGDPGDGDGDPGDGDGDPGLCGNAVIDRGEECDSANIGGQDCMALGFEGGVLNCNDDCSFDVSGCTMSACGDGVVNGQEQCDGANLDGQDCGSLGYLFGDVACAADCSFDTSGCSSQTIIDLEDGVVPAGFTGGGNAQWSITSLLQWEGTYGAVSGTISDSQLTWAQVTVQFVAPGTVSFYQRVSSEASFDYGEFYIDDQLQESWSGLGNWSLESYPVAMGQHTLRWTYDKDISIANYDDAFYVDYIVLENGYVP